jgi:phosphoribosylformimino-5-aminoimidazole carboxamide ribotide isomerase
MVDPPEALASIAMEPDFIVPVLDLAHGQAVHARGGRRAGYRPVESQLTPGQRGDALALARAFRARLGAARCYVADLDAIQGMPMQTELLAQLADPGTGFGPGLMIDAGAAGIAGGEELCRLGADTVVAGLESLLAIEEVEDLVAGIGSARAGFSLDLKHGLPVLSPGAEGRLTEAATPDALVELAVSAGVGAVIVLDLSDVGSTQGPTTLPLLRRLALRNPVPFFGGGGVASADHLAAFKAAGAAGVLVGTAIHGGVQIADFRSQISD